MKVYDVNLDNLLLVLVHDNEFSLVLVHHLEGLGVGIVITFMFGTRISVMDFSRIFQW